LRFDPIKATSPSCVERLFNPRSEAIGQKAKGIKQCAFSGAVFPNYRGHRRERFGLLYTQDSPEGDVT
jgi:hypothetical protein